MNNHSTDVNVQVLHISLLILSLGLFLHYVQYSFQYIAIPLAAMGLTFGLAWWRGRKILLGCSAFVFVIFLIALVLSYATDASEKRRGTLNLAVTRADPEWVRRKIAEGSDVNQTGADGFTPLTEAFLYMGPRTKEKSDETIERNMIEIIEILLAHGADVNRLDAHLDSRLAPLHYAAGWNYFSIESRITIIKMLIARGADVNLRDNLGNTPLHHTAIYRTYPTAVPMAKILIEHGVMVNVQNMDGDTPLHLAAQADDVELAALLIDKGADISIVNDQGETAMDIAVKNQAEQIAELLLKQKAKKKPDANSLIESGEEPKFEGENKMGEGLGSLLPMLIIPTTPLTA